MCLGVPGEVLTIEGGDGSSLAVGRVRFGGVVREVQLACVPEARVGDWVIVHVGFAIAVLDQAEAARRLALLATLEG